LDGARRNHQQKGSTWGGGQKNRWWRKGYRKGISLKEKVEGRVRARSKKEAGKANEGGPIQEFGEEEEEILPKGTCPSTLNKYNSDPVHPTSRATEKLDLKGIGQGKWVIRLVRATTGVKRGPSDRARRVGDRVAYPSDKNERPLERQDGMQVKRQLERTCVSPGSWKA